MTVPHGKRRRDHNTEDDDQNSPSWPLVAALVVIGAVAIITLHITHSADTVLIVVGPLLIALGVYKVSAK